jgi:putative glutamine amidotransferase
VALRPLVGVTADIEWHEHATPRRLHYEIDAYLSRSLYESGATVVMLPHDETEPEDLLDRLDAVLLSGGDWLFPSPDLLGDSPSDFNRHKYLRAHFELDLARYAMLRDKPLLGICGGLQVLNAATGGLLDTDLSATVAARVRHAGLNRSQTVHTVKPINGTRYATLVGTQAFAVNSQHRQGLSSVGPKAQACALADDGLVEAIECPGLRFCMGVQWHPEFLLGEPDRLLLREFVNTAKSN